MSDPIDHPIDPDGHGDLGAVLDRLLAGAPEPPPPWSGRVALLVRAARVPPAADELAGEGDIVRRMGQVIEAERMDDTRPEGVTTPAPLGVVDLAEHRARAGDTGPVSPAHAAGRRARGHRGRPRGASRFIAAKAAAVTTAAVLGVAAAAATTGIVVTMVVPAISDLARKPEPSGVSDLQPRTDPPVPGVPIGEAPEAAGDGVACPAPPGCDKASVPSTAPGSSTTTTATEPSTTLPGGDGDATTSTSLEPTTSTSTGSPTTGDTTGTTLPGRAGNAPGNGHGQGPPVTRGPGRPADGT